LSKGVILADEVGLGKTIEAALVMTQRWAERRRHLLVIVPATLRKQWQQELLDKFGLALLDSIMSLAADPDFLPERPVDPRLVRHGPALGPRFCDYTWARQLEQNRHTIGPVLFPLHVTSQPDRLEILDHCFEVALELLLAHEKAHILLGHLNSRRTPKIAEIRYLETTQDTVPTTLLRYRKEELAADFEALWMVCDKGRDSHHRKTAHLTGLDTVLDWDIYVLLAASILFCIVERCEREYKIDPHRRTHPSAAARMLHTLLAYISMVLSDTLSRDGIDIEQFFKKFWWDYLSGLTCVANIIGVAPLTLRDLQGFILLGTTLGPSDVAKELEPLLEPPIVRPRRDGKLFPIIVPDAFVFLNKHVPRP
jgi:hypothetical protein